MARQKHVHKLKKHKYKSGNAVFFCTLPDCHFKIESALALGKRAICNICDEEFIMNEYSIKLTKPHCINCGKVKVKGEDGKDKFVKKITNRILSEVAESSANDLRNRLEVATALSLEDDI